MKTTDSHIYFYSGKQCFSNWHYSPNQFVDPITGIAFDSTEQAFMWYKADFFRDSDAKILCEKEKNPSNVKNIGRLIKGYNDKAWESVRFGFMIYVNLLKFSQNPLFKDELLSTGDKILVEASPYDKIWGVGLAEDDPRIIYKEQWLGRNLLGLSLMEVRKLI